MREILKLKSFWIVWIIGSAVIYVALANFNRLYKSEVSILIIPKSQMAIANGDQIVKNFGIIARSFSFYQRIVEQNSDLENISIAELPDYKKKKYWQEKVTAEQIEKSGILKFTVSDRSRYTSEVLSANLVKELISSSAAFYDIQNDLEMRIAERPVTYDALAYPVAVLLLEGLLVGFAISFFSFYFSFFIFEKKENFPKINFDFSGWKQSKEEKPYFENEALWVPEKKKIKNEIIIDMAKTASAPDNLPVAPETSENAKEEEVATQVEMSLEEKPIIKEATPEEVKERLNKLLSGKF